MWKKSIVFSFLFICTAQTMENPVKKRRFDPYDLKIQLTSQLSACITESVFREDKEGDRDFSEITQDALRNAEYLLDIGADPDVLLSRKASAMDNCLISGVAAATRWGSEDVVRLLLRHGAKVNMDCENALVTGIKAYQLNDFKIMNILLYFGANPHLKLWHSQLESRKTPYQIAQKLSEKYPRAMRYKWCVDLLTNGHARRVYRLERYLNRLFTYKNTPLLPMDLIKKIVGYHYGPLSAEEQELIKTYSPDDYKKFREKLPVNNTCQS